MARKRALAQTTEEAPATHRLVKVIRHTGRIVQCRPAPRDSPFPSLCAMLFARDLLVYDTDVLGEGHMDLVSCMRLPAEGRECCWMVSPDGNDAVLAVVLGDTLCLVSLALSEVIAQMDIGAGPAKLSAERGILWLALAGTVRCFDWRGDEQSPGMRDETRLASSEAVAKGNKLAHPLGWSTKFPLSISSSCTGDKTAYAGLEDGSIYMLDAADGSTTSVLQHPRRKHPIRTVSELNDGRLLAVGEDGSLWLYAVLSRERRSTLDR